MTALLSSHRNSSPRDWEILSLKDAYAHREPVKYVLKGLFEVPSLNIIFGAPGTLKSMLMADLACCVVKGTDWLAPDNKVRKRGIQTTKCRALWLDFDNGKRRTHNRFAAEGRAHNLHIDDPLFYVSVPDPWLDAAKDEDIRALADLISDLKVELVIIDNLAAISGKVDENSSAMVQILLRLRWLAEHANVCIIVIHHARKTNQNGARQGDALRGHNSIEAAIDLALYVKRKGQSETITIEPTKQRGSNNPTFTATFTHTNDEYGQLATAKFISGNEKHLESSDELASIILSALGENIMNQSQLISAVRKGGGGRYSTRTITNKISTMTEIGSLTIERGKSNAKYFSKSKPEKVG